MLGMKEWRALQEGADKRACSKVQEQELIN